MNTKTHYVEVYAHRGGRSISPEHTLSAYETSLNIGTHWVDMDIGITRDGIIIAYHDLWLNPDILRKNNQFLAHDQDSFLKDLDTLPGGIDHNIQPYLIKNLTLSELQQYEIGKINPDSAYSKYFPKQRVVDSAKIVALKEIVDYVNSISNNQVNFQIEIKTDPLKKDWAALPHEFATKINEFIQKNQLEKRIEVQSFDWEPLIILHQLNPSIKLAFLIAQNDIPRMHNPDPKIAGLFSNGYLLKDYNYSLPQMVKALGGSLYEPEDIALTKEDLDEAHRLGLKVVVWSWTEHSGITFNIELIDKLITWGVDGIITDDPAKLNIMLKERGLAVPKKFGKFY